MQAPARLPVAILAAALCLSGGDAATAAPRSPWVPIFNGKDLTGWTPKIRGQLLGENWGQTFRVKDGVLEVAYDRYPAFDRRFGHLAYHRPLSSYRLRLEYRFIGQQAPGGPGWALRNSGVMIHGQPPDTMAKDQDFPVSVEVQLLGGPPAAGTARPTANVCSPGTHFVKDDKLVTQHCTNSSSPTYSGDRWVRLEIEVRGRRLVRHLVEGKEVLRYSQVQLDESDQDARKLLTAGAPKVLEAGYIYLQSESHPVQFRKIELLEEPPAPP
jgi:hypothetical protein